MQLTSAQSMASLAEPAPDRVDWYYISNVVELDEEFIRKH